jgi:hypothetical protein
VLPDAYPLSGSAEDYLDAELGFGRFLDFGVIVPRVHLLYDWSAHELEAPELLDLVSDGALTYAWPIEAGAVWRPTDSFTLRVARRTLPPQAWDPSRPAPSR